MAPLKARYHPYLFLFITLCAMAELGLTSYLINLGNQIGFAQASYHSLLVNPPLFTFLCLTCPPLQFDPIPLQFGQSQTIFSGGGSFTSIQVWSIVFGAAYTTWILNGDLHLLASMASSFIWLLVTTVLWVTSFLVPHREFRANGNLEGSAAGVLHHIRTGGSCSGHPIISQ